jgi:FixJ family two-component response regulator
MTTSKITVYVIDDNESIRRSFARLLRSENLLVDTFASPEEFFASPRKDENACIIADLKMPGSTGFDLAQQLASSGIKTPLIIISASDDWQTREHARELGAVAFFRKPVDDQALFDAIAWAVAGAGKKQGKDEGART